MHPLHLVSRFVLHTVVGLLLFVVLGGAAVLLNFGAEMIVATRVSPYIVIALRGLELFLFAVDFLCLVVFLSKETWIFVREILGPEGKRSMAKDVLSRILCWLWREVKAGTVSYFSPIRAVLRDVSEAVHAVRSHDQHGAAADRRKKSPC